MERIGGIVIKKEQGCSKGSDEYYTPIYAVKPILKYLKQKMTIWCPFDTEESNFVKELRKYGHKVIATHVFTGTDFFKCEVPECDIIVSNPPYSKKTEVLDYLFSLKRPFAMLLSARCLFESQKRFEMFRDNKFEIMCMNRRVRYLKDYKDAKPLLNPPFSSVYVCHNVLPSQIIFEEISK